MLVATHHYRCSHKAALSPVLSAAFVGRTVESFSPGNNRSSNEESDGGKRAFSSLRKSKSSPAFSMTGTSFITTTITNAAATATTGLVSSSSGSLSLSQQSTQIRHGSSSSTEQVKQRLLEASLEQVAKHGWTNDAIAAAVMLSRKDGGGQVFPLSMTGMITPLDLIEYCMETWNNGLQQEIVLYQRRQQQEENNENKESSEGPSSTTTSSSSSMPMSFWETMIQWRLQQVIPYVQCGQWHSAMALGAIQNPIVTHGQVQRIIDLVAPPETSSVVTRSALLGIYISTELHLLSDRSKEYEDTWKFLRCRLQDLEVTHSTLGPTDGNATDTITTLVQGLVASSPSPTTIYNTTTSTLQNAATTVKSGLSHSNKSNNNNNNNNTMSPPNNTAIVQAAGAVAGSLLDGVAGLIMTSQQPNSPSARSTSSGVGTSGSRTASTNNAGTRPAMNDSLSSSTYGTKASDYN